MDYKKIDEETTFRSKHSKELWMKNANESGFDYISEALVEMYKSGKSLRDIRAKMRMSRTSIKRLLTLWGIKMRGRGGAHGGLRHKEKKDQDVDYYPMTAVEIGKVLGISKTRVVQIIEEALKKFRENWIEMYGEFKFDQTDMEKIMEFLSQGVRKRKLDERGE